MDNMLEAIILAIVQGITELFPISSLGHAVILPKLLGWNLDEGSEKFLPFLVVMHLGTAAALLLYFWRDWWNFAASVLFRRGAKAMGERRLFWRVVAATIPAAIIGFALEHFLGPKFRSVFGSPWVAAVCLIANGGMLLLAEFIRRRGAGRPLSRLSWIEAAIIGALQCLAFVPGFSRSGATMAGGYLAGLNHEDAARFSFLTATPVILGAAVLEAPKIIKAHDSFSSVAIVAGVVAGVVAFVSAWVLMRWFRQTEVRGFAPFAAYCVIAGAGALTWMALHR